MKYEETKLRNNVRTICKTLGAIFLISHVSWSMDVPSSFSLLSFEEQELRRLDTFERLFASIYPPEKSEIPPSPSISKEITDKMGNLVTMAYAEEPGNVTFNYKNHRVHWQEFIESAEVYCMLINQKKRINALSLWDVPLKDIHYLLSFVTVKELTIGSLPRETSRKDQGWSSFFKSLTNHKTLQYLDINGWSFSEGDFTDLANFVVNHPHLETLAFKNITASSPGVQSPHERWHQFGKALVKAKNLQHLDLRWCQLHDAVIHLFNQEEKISSLKTLNISNNNISGKIFFHLAPLISKTFPYLVELDISGNPLLRILDPIEDIFLGYESLYSLLKECQFLHTLNIAHTIRPQFPSLAFAKTGFYTSLYLEEFANHLLHHFETLRDKLAISPDTFHEKDLSIQEEMMKTALYQKIIQNLVVALSQIQLPPFTIITPQLFSSDTKGFSDYCRQKKIKHLTLDDDLCVDLEDLFPLDPMQSYGIKSERSLQEILPLLKALEQTPPQRSSTLSPITVTFNSFSREVSRSTSRSVETMRDIYKKMFDTGEINAATVPFYFNYNSIDDARFFAQEIDQSATYKKYLQRKKNGSFVLRNFPYCHVKKLLHNMNVLHLDLSGTAEERELENGQSILQLNKKVSDQYIVHVCQDLRHHPDLRILKICGMNISQRGFRSIGTMVAPKLYLKCLDLSHNIWLGASPAFCDLLKGLKENQSIETLSFQNCSLDAAFYARTKRGNKEQSREIIVEENAKLFVSFLKKHQTLKNLNLSNNGLDRHSLPTILLALQKAKYFESLDLSSNFLLDDEDMDNSWPLFRKICRALTQQQRLSYLNFSNGISKKLNLEELRQRGVTLEAGKIIYRLPMLAYFSYQYNSLGDEGVRDILEALELKESSVRLDLSHNLLSNRAGDIIISCSKKFNTYHDIVLSDNEMNLDVMVTINQKMKQK